MANEFKKPCFRQWKGCQVEYDGDLYTHVLGIKPGSSVTEAFENLVAKFMSVNGLVDTEACCPEDAVKGGSTATLASNVQTSVRGENARSVCAGKISNASFKYWVTQSSNRLTFNWDVKGIKSALPVGYVLNQVEVAIFTAAGKNVARASADSAGVAIASTSFPLTVQFSIPLSTPCGLLYLRQQVQVDSIGAQKQGFFEIIDAGGLSNADMTQEEYNQYIHDQLCEIGQKANVAGTVSVSDKTNIKYNGDSIDYVTDLHSGLLDQLLSKEDFVDEFSYKQTKQNLDSIISDIDLRIKAANVATEQVGLKTVDQAKQIAELQAQVNALLPI